MPLDEQGFLIDAPSAPEVPATEPANPFTLPALIAWLEQQPADIPYNPENGARCVFCQWLSAAAATAIYYRGEGRYAPWELDAPIVLDSFEMEVRIARTAPFTMGAALRRAKRLLAEQSK